MNWEGLLQGDVAQQVERFTEALLQAQGSWVPHKQLRSRVSDQQWSQMPSIGHCALTSTALLGGSSCYTEKQPPTWRQRRTGPVFSG
ncbi:hypothetical protein E2C01_071386 [Portunus trituberculatus]|uniref:Uncharacterized protein n=1 Tax=Portunus trituberculatus TaxID=210409 RepID=A0A5B7I4Z1_PORTR|nr:hypothetical protein [Portunus trituberculatus]